MSDALSHIPEDGFDPREFANPNCPRCHGTGYADRGKGLLNPICACVLLRQDMAAAEKRIELSFPKAARKMTFKKFDTGDSAANKTALQVCERFVDFWHDARSEGWILGLYGMPGAGKTHLAYAMGQACIKRYFITAAAMNVPEMLRQERARFSAKRGEEGVSMIDRAIKADLLILDDLGAEYQKQTDSAVSWVEEVLYTILNERIMEMKPVIYTTNLDSDTLSKRFGGNSETNRVYSRIARNQVDLVEVKRVPGRGQQPPEARSKLRGN